MQASLQLVYCRWPEAHAALSSVRRRVFIEEQQVPEALELDELDSSCQHVLVTTAEGQPVGTARISPDGRIGRMAVLKAYRGQGVGSTMLKALLEYARQEGYSGVSLHAQVTAIPFYEKHGFRAEGAAFMDAGIAHRNMIFNPGNQVP